MNMLALKSAALATCLVTLAGCSSVKNAWNKTIASIFDKRPACVEGWYGYRQTPCPAKPGSEEITAIPTSLEYEDKLYALRQENRELSRRVKDLEQQLDQQVTARDKELAGLQSELSTEQAKLQEAQRGLIRELRPEIEKGDITVDLNNERLLIKLASG